MAIVSTGQITIVDVTDQRTISFYLEGNLGKAQIYDGNTSVYNPDYTKEMLVITPYVYFGTEKQTLATESASKVYYTVRDSKNNILFTTNTSETEATVSLINHGKNSSSANISWTNGFAQASSELLIKRNIGLTENRYRIFAIIPSNTLTDSKTGIVISAPSETNIEFSLVQNGLKGEKGSDGISISGVTQYYRLSTSNSTPPSGYNNDSGWSTSYPINGTGVLDSTNKYLWSYFKTSYVDNAIAANRSQPVVIANYAEDGINGEGITAVVDEYFFNDVAGGTTLLKGTSLPATSGNAKKLFLNTSTNVMYKCNNEATSWTQIVDLTDSGAEGTGSLKWLASSATWQYSSGYIWTRTRITKVSPSGAKSYVYTVPVCDPTVKGAIDQIKSQYDAMQAIIDNDIANLQSQVDGAIETWYYDYVPTASNVPASGWTTEDDKKKHEGDLFFNKTTGISYRYLKDGSNYVWKEIRDSDISSALGAAQAAQATANSKHTIFYLPANTEYSSYAPTGASNGDMLIDSATGNNYKYDSSKTPKWVLINGTDITGTQIYYGLGTSASSYSGITWRDNISGLSPTESSPYVWQKTVYIDRQGNVQGDPTYACLTTAAKSVSSIVTYFLINNDSSAALATNVAGNFANENSKWSTSKKTPTSSLKYLWSFSRTTYSTGGTSDTTPQVISTYVSNGTSPYLPLVSATRGHFSYTDNGSIVLTAELFQGATELTSGVTYSWSAIPSGAYSFNGSTTTSSLTITRDRLVNIATFACAMTIGDKTFTDYIVIQDKTDVINAIVMSTAGDKFTNGNISTTLECKLKNEETGNFLSNTEKAKYYCLWTRSSFSSGSLVEEPLWRNIAKDRWVKATTDGSGNTTYSKFTGKTQTAVYGGTLPENTYIEGFTLELTSSDVNSKGVFNCLVVEGADL